MHISVRHDICYKEKKKFLWPTFIRLLGHAPFNLRPESCPKFLDRMQFGFHFRDLQKLA